MSAKTISDARRYGVSEQHWDSLSERDRELYGIIRPLRNSIYSVDYPLSRIENLVEALEDNATGMGGTLQLNPDFQRGHVWSEDKKIAYIENLLRGVAPSSLRFNCSGWNDIGDGKGGNLNPGDVVCVDGLQRLTAIRDFIAGDLMIFGGLTKDDLVGTAFDPKRTTYRVSMEMFNINTRENLLQFYLDINSGGVVHSDEELSRVKGLLDEARQATPTLAKQEVRKNRGVKR